MTAACFRNYSQLIAPALGHCVVLRRTAIGLIAIGVSAIASIGGASALDYPTRPVRWVVGFAPGGSNDIIARLIGQRLSERLGQQFVIENKPGAGGNIGAELVINADPMATPCCWSIRPTNQHLALREPEIQFPARCRSGRVVHAGAERDDGERCRGEDGRRVHRLREGQPRQGQHGVSGQRHVGASVRRNVHGDG